MGRRPSPRLGIASHHAHIMASFFSTYPYAFGSLLLLAVCVAGLAICPRRHRRPMVLSALISAPYAFMSFVFVPRYWDPVRVFELSAGPEDVVFSFANGGTAWLLAIWLVRDRVRIVLRPGRIALVCVASTAPALIMTIVCSARGMPVMPVAMVTMLLTGAVLLGVRRELWPLPVAGAMGFTPIYFAVFGAVIAMWPHALAQWNAEQLWGISLLRVPLEEVAFAAVFGSVWPLLMGVALDARVLPCSSSAAVVAGHPRPSQTVQSGSQ